MDLLQQKLWFDSPAFEAEFHTEAPLGAFSSSTGTAFHLWAPTASAVTLHLYQEGAGGAALASVPLHRGSAGIWSWETVRDLDGMYYDYDITVDGVTRRSADPYAKACGLNGNRSMVIDLRRTDPPGWQEDAPPPLPSENIICELHVKDFSWDSSGGFPPEERGRYAALGRTGLTLHGDGLHPTGIDYLKRLGVTHIHLLPVFDFGSVDEAGPPDRYNWGYDPVNYNVPEGSYASDPCRGEVRIRELKAAIQALHRSGFRVIMDVVYNHTYQLDSWLWRTVPWYHYRQRADGSAANGSGCGSELASERSMCARYILDSVLYWAEEYHMDGFRFDLMGLLDTTLLERIQAALDQRFGIGEKLLFGEPWGALESAARPGTQLCTKDHLRSLSPRIAAFCDNTRDAIKGSLMDASTRGFANGGGISRWLLRQCVTGWSVGDSAQWQAPSQTIAYLSCHDDWTLWDKLVCTLAPDGDFHALHPQVLRANRLAAAIYFSCQGHVFFPAGEEFGRTKGGRKNTFRAPPQVNQLDWQRAWENQELVDYYRGLIALRKQLPCLRDKSISAPRRVLFDTDLAYRCSAVALDNSGDRTPWDQLLLIFNCHDQAQQVALPGGRWQVLVSDTSSFCWQESIFLQNHAELPPLSALILGRIPEHR